MSSDPTAIRSLAVTAEDVVAARETNLTSDRHAVLRVTPPFSGRMRARLHVLVGEDPESRPICVDPGTLLAPDAPSYPRPADTERRLRSDPDREYTVARHRAEHVEAVEAWRSEIRDSIRDRATIETPAGPTQVEIHVLG